MSYLLPLLIRRKRYLRPVQRVAPRLCSPQAVFDGMGNDTYNFGGVGPPGPPGPQGDPGPPGPPGPSGSLIIPVTLIDSTPYTVLPTDYYIGVNVAGPSTVNLPLAPTGTVYIVKDISGNALANPITIQDITTIDGAPVALINTDYGSLTFVFNGIEWNIV